MKKTFLPLLAFAFSVMTLAAKTNADPVLMTVDKKPVKLSEFEYLYQKNNAQQLSTQPVDEYLDLFVIYKLKVADAEAQGIDKTEAFRNEFAGYRHDLSEPYLTDTAARDSLIRLIYDRMHEEVLVSHIMFPKGDTPEKQAKYKSELGKVRAKILSGKVTFEQMADSVSADPGAKRNHGSQGYITSGAFPYKFEDAAFMTPVGEISEVFDTPFGWHIVKVYDRRKNRGQVKVQHILKLTQDQFGQQYSDEIKAKKQAKIDSIYNVLLAGADFDEVAKAESEDPGSAPRGGNIDWFGTGRMVPEFEQTSFALANGEISKPFRTAYGWHIVKKLDSRDIESFEVLQPRISQFIDRDERQFIPKRAQLARLRAKYNTTINDALVAEIEKAITAAGRLDSTMVANFAADTREIVTLANGNNGAIVADVFEVIPQNFDTLTPEQAVAMINDRVNEVADNATIEAERANLVNENPEYRNLLNEYRDGMLLFEVSDKNVWARSKNDTEGLKAFFEANKAKYSTWTSPRFKGYIIFATADSTLQQAMDWLAANPVTDRDLATSLRRQFNKEVRIERVLAAEGENPIIDHIAFGKAKPEPKGKWVAYAPYHTRLIDQPEEAADVRGAVTTDYQNELEANWITELRKKFPVKINKDVFKKYKKSLEK